MNSLTTRRKFDQLAAHWASSDFNVEDGIRAHKRAIGFSVARGPALDIGCGSSGRIIELLLSNGFDVEGIDISEKMLDLAKERHPNVQFYNEDIIDWDFPKKYKFISAWDSIWHIQLDKQERVLRNICRNISEGGIFIFTAGGFSQQKEVTNLYLNTFLYHATLGIPKVLRILDSSGCVCRHLEYDQLPDPHVYLIAKKI